jgi:hypothetical protein
MANLIKLKRSAVAGKAPVVGDLELGELALNTYDGKLYAKTNQSGSEAIVDLSAGGGGGGPIAETAQVISQNLTLTAGNNGLSLGPVEVAATYEVTVPANATWMVLI